MHRVMEGVRVLEVAQFTFVPAAGAVLADWGADVIKVEHPVTGDAQRGLLKVGGADNTGNINFLMEHANRSSPRFVSGVRDIPNEDLALDLPVELVFEKISHEMSLPFFRPRGRAPRS